MYFLFKLLISSVMIAIKYTDFKVPRKLQVTYAKNDILTYCSLANIAL